MIFKKYFFRMEQIRVTREISKTNTPEEQELHEKIKVLSKYESQLAQEELDLATLAAELQALNSRYTRIIGRKFAVLDRLKAEIAEFYVTQNPEDIHAQSEAQAAREKAEETERDAGKESKPRKIEAFKPTKELKHLFWKIAKLVHPDLAVDEKDRKRRTKVMAMVNEAYEEGDVERLESILTEWATSPDSIEGEDIGSRLVRTIRMIARVKRRIEQIEKDIQQLMQTDLYELKLKVEELESVGRDLISEMEAKIEKDIQKLKSHLRDLRARSQ
jgi:hypothetical protein